MNLKSLRRLFYLHDISESALSPITRTHPDTLAHSWRRGRAFYTNEKPSAWLGFVKRSSSC
ncbi:hypothetical protein FF066_18980 [Salmonella enterica]|nr:hypothetical protein [Salmonella enterica]EAW3956502.1 hypothetical protein [Salmonella enterica subsp. enterica]EBX8649438.1 hypothetical protein [Salmonella enterica subsp. enterica serovar Meleagridis]ECI0820352.1 hypothetical protein [Salmonella enterica subsp. enterica serovar Senftenberg]ECU9185003.1 hypothetical protein [Salmonella enterica subsp. enterica serovar Montevideo]EDC0986238.1 hypothetical protein [Salmonella enterica subsp. enterica serovar Give]EEK0870556.1 hypothetical